MIYMGSKRRLAKQIIASINNTELDWIEPFVGGGNIIEKVSNSKRFGYDNNKYVIAFLQELATSPDKLFEKLMELHKTFDEQTYRYYKDNKETLDPALVGFVGVACSFGAKWFGSYARSQGRDLFLEGVRNAQKQQSKIKDVVFECCDYKEVKPVKQSIIYCDPPYKGVTGYSIKDFNHDEFWVWAENMSKLGHLVYVSEYTAPAGWVCVLEVQIKEGFSRYRDNNRTKQEKLFIYKQ